jgi:hypothetical protein
MKVYKIIRYLLTEFVIRDFINFTTKLKMRSMRKQRGFNKSLSNFHAF